jgi:hypothetical protein
MNTRTGNHAATSESYKKPAAYALILDNSVSVIDVSQHHRKG